MDVKLTVDCHSVSTATTRKLIVLLSWLMIVQLLTFREFLLTPGEAVVYYISPTESPNPDCPGQPCHTLENHSCNPWDNELQ